MTDHGAFVLVNVYGPAISTEDSAEERYAFKLQFYKVALLSATKRPVLAYHAQLACDLLFLIARRLQTLLTPVSAFLESVHSMILLQNWSACIGQSCQVDTSHADMLELSIF